MKKLYMVWLWLLRWLKIILPKFDGDNKFVEWLVNKCRVKLKEDFSNTATKIMDWLVNFMYNLKGIPQGQLTDMSKKYYDMINNSTDKNVDMLCDYIIVMYNSNF